MPFATGQTAVRRCFYVNGRIAGVEAGRVISDDDRGLLLWVGEGSTVMRRTTLDGRPVRKMLVQEKLAIPTMLTPSTWRDGGILILTPPGAFHSVWWFFDQTGAFEGWYVNLEEPLGRWSGGVDLRDQALDVWVNLDRSWEWKDEDEFADRIGHPLYWTADQAPAIREEGERMIAVAQAGAFPFDGSYVDFKPEPDWEPSTLPPDWDAQTIEKGSA